MDKRITTSECAAAEEEICAGCKREDEFLVNGVGCKIQLRAEFDGEYPDEWAGGKCSRWEADHG